MKKLFSGCCCPIVYYKQFLVVGKKGITIYKEVEPNIFEEYFHTSKINNVEFLNCCEDKLYAKNSSGKFLIYDFKSNSIFAIFRYKKPLLPVEMNFYLIGEFEFLDITKTEDRKYYFTTVNVLEKTKKKEVIPLPQGYRLDSVFFDKSTKYFYSYFFSFEENSNIVQYRIDTKNMNLSVEKYKRIPDWTVLATPSFTVIQRLGDAIIKIGDDEILLKRSNDGYFVKIDFLNDNLIWVIFSTKFLLFDIKSKTVIKEFPLKYCFDVCCDKNRIFFGTWEGLYMEEASFDL